MSVYLYQNPNTGKVQEGLWPNQQQFPKDLIATATGLAKVELLRSAKALMSTLPEGNWRVEIK